MSTNQGTELTTTRVGVLGPVAAWVDGEEVVVGPPLQQAVLAVLALAAGGVVSRDLIIDSVWGAEPPGSAPHAVQVYVSGIRRVLGARAVETVAPGYRLGGHVTVDAAGQSQLLDAARAAEGRNEPDRVASLLREALAAWRGDPLAGLEDVPFSLTETARLQDLRATVRVLHLAAEIAIGNHQAVIGELEALVEDVADREEPQRLLLLALHRAGRREEALTRYEQWRRRLADELGLDPSPAMQQLQLGLLNHDASLDAPARSAPSAPPLNRVVRLPVERTRFVGREDEIESLLEKVAGPGLTTLVGTGGVGKTRLALAVARLVADEQRDEHPDGVVFVDLADETDVDMIPVTTAMALGLSVAGPGDGWQQYASAIASRRCFIVLDNLEHLDGAGRYVGELLDLAPASTVLATSRTRLGTAGEQVVTTRPLRTDGPRSSAGELFRRRAADVAPEIALDDDEITALVRWLDGIPLAIELAAGRVGLLTPGELLRVLESSGSAALADGPVDAPARHRSLERSLRWSYELLDTGDKSLLRRLAIFDGSFTIDSARAVGGGAPVGDVFAGLGRLLDAHLLQRTVGGGPARFRTLLPVREFARGALEQSDETDVVRSRHVAHHLSLAAQFGPLLTGPDRRTALDAFDHSHSDIDLALRRADAAEALNTAWAMWRAWQIRGRTAHGRALVEELLATLAAAKVDESDPTVLRGRLLIAHLQYWQRESVEAHAGYLEVAAAARDHDAGLAVEALASAGLTAGYLGMAPDALPAILEEITPLARALGSPRRLCDAHSVAYFDAMRRGQVVEARRELHEARRLAEESGDLRFAARIDQAVCRLGLAHADAPGAFEAALAAVDYAASVDDLPMLVHSLDWSGAALAELGHHAAAVEVEAGVEALRQRIGAGLHLGDRSAETPRQRVTSHLDEADVSAAWARGFQLDHASVVALVRRHATNGPRTSSTP